MEKERELLSEPELCAKTGISRKTLYFWRLQGMPFVEIGRVRIGYYEDDVRAWMKANLKRQYGNRSKACQGKKGAKN